MSHIRITIDIQTDEEQPERAISSYVEEVHDTIKGLEDLGVDFHNPDNLGNSYNRGWGLRFRMKNIP